VGLDGYSAYRGETPSALRSQQFEERAVGLRVAAKVDSDIVFVHGYDPIAQTVSVLLASDRGAKPLRDIPIAGAGGNGLRIIRAWKSVSETDKPDIGVLVYPRIGSLRKALDYIRRDANATFARIERTAIFFGGIPASASAGESPTANVVATAPALHQIGKGDNGIVSPRGAGILVKEDDTLVLRGRKIVALGLDQAESDAKAVGRNGDGSVTSISASTTKLYSG
jgi:hypothetical protein